ncbi:lysophospholipid acyltransferase family protein [Ghiorsea bivora]|uniref:lysophospholipid acyltransferase family protein n=1 Tax=Ghiorsea bivora TaxID=1485545 RepID=UPI00068B8432|nr:lysophospholipid acyltransferase family protein [Ghiorsea bivora]
MSKETIKVPIWTRLLFSGLAKVPMPIMHALGDVLGWLYYTLDKRHRNIALRNLARVFPEKPKKERKKIAKKAFKQMGRTLMEIPYVFSESREDLLAHVEIENKDVLTDALAQQKGVFLLASHFSNWELMGLMPAMMGYQTSMIYRQLNQKPLDAYTLASRSRFGTHLYSRNTGVRWLLKALKNNHCIVSALDQHMGAGNGIKVPFLGHIASTSHLPAPFVAKGVPMIGMALVRQNNDFKFTLKFWDVPCPELTDDKATNEVLIMTAACKSFDDVIKENPEQWLWMHRRWRAVETDDNMTQVVHGAP